MQFWLDYFLVLDPQCRLLHPLMKTRYGDGIICLTSSFAVRFPQALAFNLENDAFVSCCQMHVMWKENAWIQKSPAVACEAGSERAGAAGAKRLARSTAGSAAASGSAQDT